MARRFAKPAGGKVPPPPADEASSCTPDPPGKLHLTLTSLAKGEVLHRVHQSKYQADEFNPGVRGNARFSPIQDEHGKPIPTLYGGTMMACALMETVFHDVPHTAGFKIFDNPSGRIDDAVYCQPSYACSNSIVLLIGVSEMVAPFFLPPWSVKRL